MLICASIILLLDQWIKYLFLQGLSFDSMAITLGGRGLVFNTGVAFSMLSFLGEYLKYIQLALIIILGFFVAFSGLINKHFIPIGLILGAGLSNVLDRFIHIGVVDYVYWHYGFEFAIFNFADVMIDIGVFIIILQILLERKKIKS